MMLINTVICDDHPLVSLALKTVLRSDPEFNIVAEPNSGPALIAQLRAQRCDLVVLDYSMPGELDGIGLIQYLTRMFPETRLLVFSSMASAVLANRCIEAGAHGFMRKTQSGERMREAIRCVAKGQTYIDPWLQGDVKRAAGFEQAFLTLSPREMVVVRLLLTGQTVSEIALRLNRSIKTVSTQKQTAFRKLDIQSDAELYRLAGDMGMTDAALPSGSAE